MSGGAIGMMDPAYFVGRREILAWLNGTFQMNLGKIEEAASGAVACQVLDAIFPGDVPMSKVRWDAKSAHEFIDNYKVIQSVLEKKGVDKHIEVEKLMRAKYQDNLELMQWFKSFFGKNYNGQPYDPIARRARGKGADSMPAFALDAARRGTSRVEDGPAEDAPSKAGSAAPRGAAASTRKSTGAGEEQRRQQAPVRAAELTKEVDDLRLSVESLEKERDFYFGKLRDIEVLLQGWTGGGAM